MMPRCPRSAIAAAPLVALVTACSGGGAPAAAPAPSPTPPVSVTTTAVPTTTPPTTAGTTTAPSSTTTRLTDLADGRYPAHISSVSAASRTIVADVVQWFTGDAAVTAAAEDHSPAPED